MAKGWNEIEQQAAATAEQRARYEAGFKPELRVGAKTPGPFIIRFCEQGPDVNNFPVHPYDVPDGKGGTFSRRFTCRKEIGEDCPGCNAGMKLKRRGVYNVIQRQRPIFRKGQDGKAIYVNSEPIVDGAQDEVVIANVGGPTANMLRQLDGKMQGLMSRDFDVTFSGDTFQSWNITAVMDGAGNSMATPMSEADILLANAKHNLDEYMKPPSFQEAAQIVAQYGPASASGGHAPAQQHQAAQAAAPPLGNDFLAGADLPPGVPPNTFGTVGAVPPAAPVAPAPATAPVAPTTASPEQAAAVTEQVEQATAAATTPPAQPAPAQG